LSHDFCEGKIAIEELEEGQILEIKMNEGEPILNVPRSFKEEGHRVLDVVNNEDGTFTVFVERARYEKLYRSWHYANERYNLKTKICKANV